MDIKRPPKYPTWVRYILAPFVILDMFIRGGWKFPIMHAEASTAKKKYPELVGAISQCLFEDDPIGINFENNTDEYDPEAATILPKLKDCKSEDDVLKVVYTEFCRWFGTQTAGSISRYTKVSSLIWQIWISNAKTK